MTKDEIIVHQAAEIIELRDKLDEANEVKNYWFRETQRSIRVRIPSPAEEHNLILELIKMGAKL